MDIPALIARFRTLGGPQGSAAARALLASINSTPDLRMKTPLSQIRDLEAIAGGPSMYGKAEQDETPKRKFCSTQFNIEGDAKAAILAMAKTIPNADLADDGRETEPHITIKYGLHDSDPRPIQAAVAGFGPVKVKLGKTSIFAAKEATAQRGGEQYDVVKIEIEGEDIHRLNKLVADSAEHTDTHPVYKPHATLAYVKAGEGKKYVGMDDVEGMELTFTSFVFSPAEGERSVMQLDAKAAYGKAEHDPYAEEALALARLHADGFNAQLDCGLPVLASDIEHAQLELADVGGRIEYADGQWCARADAESGGVKMYGRWYWAGEEQDEPAVVFYAASEWVAEKSTKSKNPSGNRYRNTRTGQIRYFKKPPMTRDQRQDEMRGRGDVDREKLKQRTQGHAGQDDAAVKKQAANAFRALYYHHGDFVVHRLQELADDTEAALGKAQEGTPAHSALKRKMAAVNHMLSHAEERGISGKAPEKMVAEKAPAEPWAGKGEPELGKVYNAPTGALEVDPKRFQFKLKTDASGVTQELKAVQTWNPDFAGTLAVWKDPGDGKTYVVNGHHRRELAGRLGVEDMAVRYIDAKTPEEARAKGALINIAEGRGTPVDAAKFMRDTGVGPEEMAKTGVSLKGKLAEDAVALTALSGNLFDRVARDEMELGKALAIGRNLPDHARQEKLVKILDKREEDGKDISLRTVEEMAKEMAAVPAVTRNDAAEGMGLFGNEDYEDDVFVERNELKGYVRNQLAQDVNDFAVVASKRRADKVAGAGNTLDVEKNKATSEEADRVRNTFDRMVNLRGPVSEALNSAAKEYAAAKGKKAKDAAKQRAIEVVRSAVAAESGAGAGQQQAQPDGTAAVAQEGNGQRSSDAAGQPKAAADDAGRASPGQSGLNPSVPLADQRKSLHNTNGETPQKEAENGRQQDPEPGRVPERKAVSADDSAAGTVRPAGTERPADDRRVQPGQAAGEGGKRRESDGRADGSAGGTRGKGSVGADAEQAGGRGDEGPAASPGSGKQVAPKADPSTTAFFTPPPVQGNLLNDNGGEWVKPLTSGEKAKPLYAPNSDKPTRTKEEIDGKSAIQRSMEAKEQAAKSKAQAPDEVQTLPTEFEDTSSPAEQAPQASPAAEEPGLAEGDEVVASQAVDPSTPQGVASHFQFDPQGDGLSDRLDRVYEGVKAGVPSLTPEKWRSFLQKAWDAKALELQGINEVRGVLDTPGASDKVLQKKDANGDVGRMLAYAVVKDPQKLQAMIQQELMGQGGADSQQADTRQAEKQYGWMNQADLMKVAQQKGVKIDPRDDRTKILQKLSAS